LSGRRLVVVEAPPVPPSHPAELLVLEGARPETVERSFREATETARRLGTRWYELRAATALARWLQTQGRIAEAHAILAPLCASFREGLETRDFREAVALVEELGEAVRRDLGHRLP
jgi:predicted ATPase